MIVLAVKLVFCCSMIVTGSGVMLWCAENDPKAKEQEKQQQRQIYESFRSGPFEDIVSRSADNVIFHIFLLLIQ